MHILRLVAFLWLFPLLAFAQEPPYDQAPEAIPPYYRIRYEGSLQPGDLAFPVQYTVWIPEGVKTIRGVIVHQHGCGEGSCRSGQTGAFDLHWQALAQKHDCALLSPSYEQPEGANCQLWCDPRNGSDEFFQQALVDLGKACGHEELSTVPWALWGHSGGGLWSGAMTMLHPDRVAAAWLRSGVPMLQPNETRPELKPFPIPDAALTVPILCNLGTKEGVSVTEGRFTGVWPSNRTFYTILRERDGLVGVAIDPLTSHECGNQRYLAIPWLDFCLSQRLPDRIGDPLKAMSATDSWLADPLTTEAHPAADYAGDPKTAAWLPNAALAQAWMEYRKDTKVTDTTPPPAPSEVKQSGAEITWTDEADVESGLARFHIERDGEIIASLPEKPASPFGRPLFQGLQYSDTPAAPLVKMRFVDPNPPPGKTHRYRVIAENTVGLKSK